MLINWFLPPQPPKHLMQCRPCAMAQEGREAFFFHSCTNGLAGACMQNRLPHEYDTILVALVLWIYTILLFLPHKIFFCLSIHWWMIYIRWKLFEIQWYFLKLYFYGLWFKGHFAKNSWHYFIEGIIQARVFFEELWYTCIFSYNKISDFQSENSILTHWILEGQIDFWSNILLFRTQTACYTKSKYSLKAIHFVNSVCTIFSLWKKDPPHQTFPS